jgi:hypothetical protein
MGERKFGSQSYLSTSDKRNHLAIYIGLGTRRTRLWWQTSGETPAWSWDSLVEAFLTSSKIILLSQPGKHLSLYRQFIALLHVAKLAAQDAFK